MVSAFSEAGGLGCLASAGMQENVFRDQIQKIRQQTDAPFAVNIPWTVPNSEDILRWCLEEDVEIIISSAGSPAKSLEKIKSANKRVFQVVSNMLQAKRAETLDLDGIITKGFESGGLNSLGTIATLPLVPMVVDSVSIPVIAAGGIGDGRGMAAAMALGAEGVLMGTRFLLSEECPIHASLKNALLDARDTDTVTVAFTDFSVRFWKNKKAISIKGNEPLWELIASDLSRENDADNKLIGSGQILGLDQSILSISEIFQEILKGFENSVKMLNEITVKLPFC
jgi:enoyl-[acyl-carrier protein] reductase II